ncbi:hypothetical protein SS50377_20120 [Spironucleus salmonicida]|uniref:Uncharacterized protein n=1 Tax=Spironucleus salmonicida TaxID=348837 RepID=V6LKU9_9EUKA|nr:hypothetical protein SS50377_20120 [Spironucleus salmonicida]|eukprot:EST45177.1 Hypothetical protein SS50377_14750 [Spironucleus salmonicida]
MESLIQHQFALKQQKQYLVTQISNSMKDQSEILEASNSLYHTTQDLIKQREILSNAISSKKVNEEVSVHELEIQNRGITQELKESKKQMEQELQLLQSLKSQISTLKGKVRTICLAQNIERSHGLKFDKSSILVPEIKLINQPQKIFEFQQISTEMIDFDSNEDKFIYIFGHFQDKIEEILSQEIGSALYNQCWVTLGIVSIQGDDLISGKQVIQMVNTEIPIKTINHALGIIKSVRLESEFIISIKTKHNACILSFQNDKSTEFAVSWIKYQLQKQYTMFSVCCIDFQQKNAMQYLEKTSEIKGVKVVQVKDLYTQ